MRNCVPPRLSDLCGRLLACVCTERGTACQIDRKVNQSMVYEQKFTDTDLEKVVEQGTVYMCACPAQVAESLRNLRALYNYQQSCLQNPQNDSAVHQTIALRVAQAHRVMEQCLEEIIILEKWDRDSMKMPSNLRVRQLREMASDD